MVGALLIAGTDATALDELMRRKLLRDLIASAAPIAS